MAQKEVSKSVLKNLGGNVAMKNAMKSNQEYTGRTGGGSVPQKVRGTARLSSVGLRQSDKGWITFNCTGVCVEPAEYQGLQLYPQFMFHPDQIKSDDEQADRAVKGMIDLLRGLGISDEAINPIKGSKDFFNDAFALIEASSGSAFKFSTLPDKKDAKYTRYYANGPVESNGEAVRGQDETVSDPEGAPEAGVEGVPMVGEEWTRKSDSVAFKITAVANDDREVTLKGPSGPKSVVTWDELSNEYDCTALAS